MNFFYNIVSFYRIIILSLLFSNNLFSQLNSFYDEWVPRSFSINFNNLDSDKIFFAGGGSKNPLIKREILKRTGLDEIKTLPWGFDFKNIESSAFAWLAMRRVKGKLISKGYITGAKKSRLLGIIYR